jgi:hypothetical protein
VGRAELGWTGAGFEGASGYVTVGFMGIRNLDSLYINHNTCSNRPPALSHIYQIIVVPYVSVPIVVLVVVVQGTVGYGEQSYFD